MKGVSTRVHDDEANIDYFIVADSLENLRKAWEGLGRTGQFDETVIVPVSLERTDK